MNTSKTALITGASGGIGLELARVHASKGDHLVLVARSADRLSALKSELEQRWKVRVTFFATDLSLPDAARTIYNELKNQSISVDYLINNAGFGEFGFFHETNWEREEKMIQLNITTLTQFTKLFLKDMVARGSGRIMNVASTAAFQPGPTMAVYYATKAYVLHFSEAVNNEVRDKGVTVTALCPGPTESGFQEAASLKGSRLVSLRRFPSSESVAKYGYKAMMKGKAVAIHGGLNVLLTFTVRLTPRWLIVRLIRFVQGKST
ncbi:MAG: SDR family oxidoreductase [Bacteroidetes bacterium]|nr:SDR family oxidoreductase [Bacteroidota bacterium]